jgi:Bromodomain
MHTYCSAYTSFLYCARVHDAPIHPFCTGRNTAYGNQVALKTTVQRSLLQACLAVLSRVKGRPECKMWFAQPVDLKAIPNYLSVIKNPIDFGTISKNLHSKKYRSPVSKLLCLCCVFAVSLLPQQQQQQQQSLLLLLVMLSYCCDAPNASSTESCYTDLC